MIVRAPGPAFLLELDQVRKQRALGPCVQLLGNVFVDVPDELSGRQTGICFQCVDNLAFALQAVIDDPVDDVLCLENLVAVPGEERCRLQRLDLLERGDVLTHVAVRGIDDDR